ncbi:Protein of unknown function [Streptomyces sp. DvalAA-14]|uniref:DUF2637 domain-containing protein n=1 Tax=unclassified Streptomyces TaxID=2593676 RepID=UPI00081B5E29|nr:MULTISPECIES: DUF2637 domain-containing protein [unclassified Streptomyces]MYS22523.1 DUF2637 domain-containing protein [Streptomyces sp. SID4948]SCE17679.1 Protein of unknown function [Streptomyces sp. DvalAA-14]
MPTPIPPPTHADRIANRPRRRSLPYDRLAILLLGACGCVLSFDSLRQIALATHVRPELSYLFPVVIDGFIAYGIRAILLLRDAPLSARLYAWTPFAAATAASLWANSLDSMRLNTPGTHVLVLGNHTVAVLSTIAPMALGGATHLHILVTRHAQSHSPESVAAGTPSPNPAAAEVIPAAESAASHTEIRQQPTTETPAAGIPGRKTATSGTDRTRSRARTGTGRPGRRADATIDDLAAIIAAAHPDAGQVSRTAAREAIQAAGLSAGNDRITQALTRLSQSRSTKPGPPTD